MKDDDAKTKTEARAVAPRPAVTPKPAPIVPTPVVNAPTTLFGLDVPTLPTLQLVVVDKTLVEKIVERMKEL